jgi:glycosyltransferase involved in cell wall biosynthesis
VIFNTMPTQIPIAIFVDRYIAGGTQRQMIELLKRIDRRRFRVYPVCFHGDGPWVNRVAELGDPIAHFPIHGFRRPDTARQLFSFARWCRSKGIAVMHTWEIYSNIFGLPGAALGGVPVRIGSRRGLGGPPGARLLQRAAYRAAHRIVANSQAAAQQVAADGVPEGRIIVISNGIDPSIVPRIHYSARPRRIAVVACLRQEKRIDVLIAAAPRVLERHPDAEFLIVGDGPCREQLTALARATAVFDRFQFLGHRDDVPAVLAQADLLVLPSQSEAFPNAIIEAMAAGLPVVATHVGGIPELVEEGRTGRLVPPGDANALAGALLDVLDPPARAAEFGRAGRRRIEETYSFDRMVEQFETLYVSELERSHARRQSGFHGMKPIVKHALMTAYLASRLPAARDRIYAKLGHGRLTVVTYHQVKSPADDGSSVGPAEFREQMRFLRANYRVVPLADAVKALSAAGATERLVAITFDDGYLDNATAAAPILRSLDLPATFFVSTDMIGRCPVARGSGLRYRVSYLQPCRHGSDLPRAGPARAAGVASEARRGTEAPDKPLRVSLRPPAQYAAGHDGCRTPGVRSLLLRLWRPQYSAHGSGAHPSSCDLVRRDVPGVSRSDRRLANGEAYEHSPAVGSGRCPAGGTVGP